MDEKGVDKNGVDENGAPMRVLIRVEADRNLNTADALADSVSERGCSELVTKPSGGGL